MIEVREALPDETAGIASYLAREPLPGPVSLCCDCSPDYLAALPPRGSRHLVVIARQAGEIVGLCACSIKTLLVGGDQLRLGYLHDLRVSQKCRQSTVLGRMLSLVRRLETSGEVSGFISSVPSGLPAGRALWRSRRSLPSIRSLGRFITQIFYNGRRSTVRILQADPAACEGRFLAELSGRAFFEPPEFHLTPTEIAIIAGPAEAPAAGAVCADYLASRRLVLRTLSRPAAVITGALNVWSRIRGLPPVVRRGEPLRLCHLHNLFASPGEEHLNALRKQLYAVMTERKLDFAAATFSERDPLAARLKRHACCSYSTELFLAASRPAAVLDLICAGGLYCRLNSGSL